MVHLLKLLHLVAMLWKVADSISFIPQFTTFLCCNKFYKVEPADATENLEQFEYKSKFVNADELIADVPFLKLKDDYI